MTTITDEMIDAAMLVFVQPPYHREFTHFRASVRDALEAALAAEIEPKPADGRRLENRIANVEADVTGLTKRLNTKISTLTATVEQQGRELAEMRAAIADQDRRLAVDSPSDWQGASVQFCVKALAEHLFEHFEESSIQPLSGLIEQALCAADPQGYLDRMNADTHAQPEPTAMRIDANGDDEKWQRIEDVFYETDSGEDGFDDFRSAVSEAIRQGLVSPRIDPENEEQVRVVENALPGLVRHCEPGLSKRILSSLSQVGATHE